MRRGFMGRYCFYCGKQLEPSEACDCRYARENAKRRQEESGSSSSSSTSSQSNTTSETTSTNTSSNSSAQNTQSSEQDSKASSERVRAYQESKEAHQAKQNKDKKDAKSDDGFFKKAFSRTKTSDNKGSSKSSQGQNSREKVKAKPTGQASNIWRYIRNIFTSPTQLIADISYASWANVIVTNLALVLLYGLVITVFFRNSNIVQLLILRDSTAWSGILARQSMNAFIRAGIVFAIVVLIRTGIAYLLIRFAGRQRVDFTSIWRILLPGTYYEIVSLLITLLFANGTGLQALILIAAAFGVRAVIDLSSVKHHFSISNDRLILFTLTGLTLIYIIAAFSINIVIPSIGNFSALPFSNPPQEFTPNAWFGMNWLL